MKTDNDGYPTVCVVCGKPIVKARADSQHHYDHVAKEATSWHAECARSPHPFFCKGKPATLTLVLGSWFCSECGLKIEWAIT